MTSNPQDSAVDPLDLEDGLPEAAPEADVLEQHQTSSGYDDRDRTGADLPVEADPADVEEQRRSIGDDDADDYR